MTPAPGTRGLTLACPCGEVYELRPEYAGRLLECPVCGRHLRAGGATVRPRADGAPVDPAFERDVFLLRQRLFAVQSKYDVRAEDGTPLLFIARPTYPIRTALAYVLAAIAATLTLEWAVGAAARAGPAFGWLLALLGLALTATVFMAVSLSARPRRHVTVFRDSSRHEVVLRVRQDQRLAVVTRTFTLLTSSGEMLARFRKRYLHNLLRKRWDVEAPGGQAIALAVEDSVILSLLRRVLGSFFGLLRTNFVLIHAGGATAGTVFGEFNRTFTLLDRYVLDLRGDPGRAIDRRVALALGVLLDTGERR